MHLTDLSQKLQPQFEAELVQLLATEGSVETIEADEMLIDIGDSVSSIPILLSGSIKVSIEDANRGELLLYYLESGQTCSITMECCDGKSSSKVRAITELKSEILFIPTALVSRLTSSYPSWNHFVLNSFNSRLNDLLKSVDSLAFDDLSKRLENYLIEKSRVNGSNKIETTHLDIAKDLNTSRVVISRLLKNMELNGQIHLSRGVIEIEIA